MFNTKPWNAGFPGIPKEVEQDISNLQSRAAALETANSYSTTAEVVIGKWVDGRPIYRKTYNAGELPNATIKNVASGLTNIEVLRIYGWAVESSGQYFMLPHVDPSNVNTAIGVYYTAGNNIVIKAGIDRSGYSGYLTIEYVKKPATRDSDTEPEKDPEEVKEPETKTTKKAKKGE